MFSAPVMEKAGDFNSIQLISDTQVAVSAASMTDGGVNIIRRDSVENNTPPGIGTRTKKVIRDFFQKSWRVIGRACCCIYVEDGDFSDPQPGPSWAWPMQGQGSAAREPDGQTESVSVSGPSSPETADTKTKQMAEPEAAKPESSQSARAESVSVSGPSSPRKAKTQTNKRKGARSDSSTSQPTTDEPAVPKQSSESESSPVGTHVTDLTEPVNAPFASLYNLGEKLGKRRRDLFLGTRKSDGQTVVIKVIPKLTQKRFIPVSGTNKRLPAEVALNVKMTGDESMRSPYVLNLLQWFDDPEKYILVFEYLHSCETLEHFIKTKGGCLDERQARDLIVQAVLAAKDCIDRDLFHRNIMLKNILINTSTLKIKLTDFSSGQFTSTDFDRYNAEISMVWFVGDMLCRMLHGRPPYTSESGEVVRTLNFHSSLSGECCSFLCKCLIKKSVYRASLQELLTHKWFHGVV